MKDIPVYDSGAHLMAATDLELYALAEAIRKERYRQDPVAWMKDRPGEVPWSKQAEIAYSVRDNRQTAVPACHDSGKSWAAAAIALWWIDVHQPGEAFVVTTAPTAHQVKAILWREMNRMHAKAGLSGQMNKTDWSIDGQLVAFGRKPSDYDPAVLQGSHANKMLVILDEACGISRSIWTQAETLITSEGSRLLAIGNPDDASGPFAKACRPGSGYNVIKISAFDTPNFTGEVVAPAVGAQLLGKTWVEERRQRWGEGSGLYTAKVLGEFPDLSDDSLLSVSWVERARERSLAEEGEGILGVDVARFGSAETVIALRRGGVVRVIYAHSGQDTMQTAGAVAQALNKPRIGMAKIDDVGVGGGVLDRLRQLGLPAVGLNGGRRPRDRQRFVNARAEWYWHFRELLEHGEVDIDPDDEVLAEQLCSIKYKTDAFGRIQIESKDDMRRRGMASPDRADAVVLAFADGDFRQRPRITTARISR
jgi:hypothetical protein